MTTASIALTSDAFADGATMPDALIFDRGNISPALRWTGVPAGTKSLALAVHDPDAPTTVGFTHWILFDLDPALTGLAAGAGKHGANPPGSIHGLTDFGQREYGGPAPPPGDPPHRYHVTLYALDVPKLAGAGDALTYPRFRFMIRGHILAEGTLTGRYGR
jgi:Raf kinase inhibitor-like YbhB/YbcL family protein